MHVIDESTGEIVERHVRPFAEWLVEQRQGAAHTELSEQFNRLCEAVRDFGKVGTLTLAVKVRPAGHGVSTVMISETVTVKPPTGERAETIFFVDGEANLSRRDPNQTQLPIHEVGTMKKEA